MQNYSGCNGNYINFYSKLVPKIIMTELFKKPCFWSLLTYGLIVPQTLAALVAKIIKIIKIIIVEDYKFLPTYKKVE